MTPILAATGSEAALAFIEIGLVALGLGILSRLASRMGLSAVPFYLVVGLLFGEGGIARIDVSTEFVEIAAEIGVLLLLLTLGLEYDPTELRRGLRTTAMPGAIDAIANALPGVIAGLVLGWSFPGAILLGGVTWISSSGVISKVLSDLDRIGYRETPAILNLLVIEDLAMAVYLPVVAALVIGDDPAATATTVAIALAAVAVLLWAGTRFGTRVSDRLAIGTDESVLLGVFGLTLVVGGLAQQLEVSAAVGAFIVGLSLSGEAQHRSMTVVAPLRDLFAAVFFVAFSFQIDPADLVPALVPAVVLAIVTAGTKMVSGWVAAGRLGVGTAGRIRAGATLIARGEFSIVIAALGVGLAESVELGAVAAAYVLITAVMGPLIAKNADRLVPRNRAVPQRS